MNSFEIFSEIPRPWLDSDRLKQKFLTLCSPIHPDRVHQLDPMERERCNQAFAVLNTAYRNLLNPKDRLMELLRMTRGEAGEIPLKVPEGWMDLFFSLGNFCRETDHFIAKSTAPDLQAMVRASLLLEKQDWWDRCESMEKQLEQLKAQVVKEIKALDAEWLGQTDKTSYLGILESLIAKCALLGRWEGWVSERKVALKTFVKF